MKCPNCGTLERGRVRICPTCGVVYASEDLLELRQLEFLLQETATWPGSEALRPVYSERLEQLKARLLPPKAIPEPEAPAPILAEATPVAGAVEAAMPEAMPMAEGVETAIAEAAHPIAEPAIPVRPAAKPKAEAVPFDQWLLSERNIKIALYTGGLLLIIAGLIFVGVKWGQFSGPVKFTITLMITGLMYLGGYLLFRHPPLKIGGVALLAVASGFLPLNFVVLQLYIFRGRGLDDTAMWLIGSLPVMVIYLLTAYWTRTDLFTYLSMAALASAITACLVLLDVTLTAYLLVYALLALGFLLAARWLQARAARDFAYLPLQIVSQVAMPFLFIASFSFWVATTGCLTCPKGSPWLALIAMLTGVLFYIVTYLGFRWMVAKWAAAVAFGLVFSLVMVEIALQAPAISLSMMGLFLIYLLAGYVLEWKPRSIKQEEAQPKLSSDFTRLPMIVVPQIAVPVLFITGVIFWGFEVGNQWLALATLLAGVAFYVITDLAFHWILARWAAAVALGVVVTLTLIELDIPAKNLSILLMVLSLGYLIVGSALERRTGKRSQGLPLYATGYALAAFVTLEVIGAEGINSDDMAQVLLGDVVLLAVSAAIHRQIYWVYGAAWLFMAPVAIYANIILRDSVSIGLTLGVLMLIYVTAGVILSRRALKFGLPFLSAGAFLSVVIIPLVWANPAVASAALGVVAMLYLGVALWMRLPWLTLPALAAAHLSMVSIVDLFIVDLFWAAGSPWQSTLTITYATIGVALMLGGYALRLRGKAEWRWPLVIFAALDLVVSYLSALTLGGWIAIGLSGVYASLAFWLAWAERETFEKLKIPAALMSYLGVAILFIGHFFIFSFINNGRYIWPPFTIALCAALVVLSWLLRRDKLEQIYGIPLHWSGLVLSLVPVIGVLVLAAPDILKRLNLGGGYSAISLVEVAITFAIAGTLYVVDAIKQRNVWLGYLGGGTFVIVLWSLFGQYNVKEPQAYYFLAGMGLVVLGWNERRRGKVSTYRWSTLAGLLVLMGSAFYQSLSDPIYAYLLLFESLIAMGWGIRAHSRGYVQVSVIALIVNAVVQIGPAFVELPRWVQIGVIGSILLGGGMMGLFRRDQIITRRRIISEEWKRWQP